MLELVPSSRAVSLVELVTGLLMLLNVVMAGWLVARPRRGSVQRAGSGRMRTPSRDGSADAAWGESGTTA